MVHMGDVRGIFRICVSRMSNNKQLMFLVCSVFVSVYMNEISLPLIISHSPVPGMRTFMSFLQIHKKFSPIDRSVLRQTRSCFGRQTSEVKEELSDSSHFLSQITEHFKILDFLMTPSSAFVHLLMSHQQTHFRKRKKKVHESAQVNVMRL